MFPRYAFPSFLTCLTLLRGPFLWSAPPKASHQERPDCYGDPLPEGAVFRIGTTRLRHSTGYTRPFVNVLFSPNGQFVLSSADGEQEVRMCETTTGREVRRFPAELIDPTFALSADGSLLAVGDINQIHLYDTATGKKQRTILIKPVSAVRAAHLYFSPDGKSLTAYHDGEQPDKNRVSRWETATGKMIETIWKSSTDWPAAYSADARSLATTSAEKKTICLWETATGTKVREWKMVGEAPLGNRSLIFSPDGRNIVMAGDDAMIRVYETATGKETRNWPAPLRQEDSSESNRYPTWLLYHSVHYRAVLDGLAFAPDGRTLASVDRNNVLRLWDWKSGRELRHFKGVSGPVAFSPDGKTIAAAGVDCRIRLWSTETGRDLCPFADPGKIVNVAFSPDGRVLAAGSDRGRSRLFDTGDGRELRQFPGYRLLAFSPKGVSLLALRQQGDRFGPLGLLDPATGRERNRFRDTKEDSFFGGWDADKDLLLTTDGTSVRVWDTATGNLRREIRGRRAWDETHCSPDGRIVAVTNRGDSLIRLLATDTGKELRSLTGYNCVVCYEARRGKAHASGGGDHHPVFSPNGKVLLAGCGPTSLGLWDVSTGKQFLRLSCDQLLPHTPIFSPNGDLLSLLNTQGDPCLVDAATGRVRHRLTWKGGDLIWILESVNRAFSPDGRMLAAAYDPHTLALWEVATGRLIRTWPGHGRGKLRQMVFSTDSRRLATVGTDGTVLVWDVMGLRPDGQLPARKLTLAEMEEMWRDLADSDTAKAHRAVWSLVADPERALPLLRERLHPAAAVDPHRLTRLMDDLDKDDFSVRESATRELRKLGELARPALRAAMKDRPSLELRRRVRGLLDDLDGAALPAESWRDLRAVAVLEHIGGVEARPLLRALAGGAPKARLTHEAKASLERMSKRQAIKP